jgi:hypothetical protein
MNVPTSRTPIRWTPTTLESSDHVEFAKKTVSCNWGSRQGHRGASIVHLILRGVEPFRAAVGWLRPQRTSLPDSRVQDELGYRAGRKSMKKVWACAFIASKSHDRHIDILGLLLCGFPPSWGARGRRFPGPPIILV